MAVTSFPTIRENQNRPPQPPPAPEPAKTPEPLGKEAPASPPSPAKPAKPMKPEDMAGLQAFVKRGMRGLRPPEDEPGAKPTKEPAPAKPKPAAQQFKPKPPPKAPPAPAPTATEIAVATAEAVARAIRPDGDGGKKLAEPQEKPLSDSDQRKMAVLAKMEAGNEKYKGIAERYAKSIRELQEYSEKWEQAHPGQEFDEESPEHTAFFKQHDVDWQDDDFEDARIALAAEKLMDKRLEGTQKKLAALEQKDQLREAEANIKASKDEAARQFWSGLGDEFKDVIGENGSLNEAKLKELKESDPVSFAERIRFASALDVEVAEIHKLYNRLVDNDPANPVHKNVVGFILESESKLQARPLQERLDQQGRDFVPARKYWDMPKAERDKHWTFTETDVKFMRAAQLAAMAQTNVQQKEAQFREWAKARGIDLPGDKAGQAPTPQRQPAAAEVEDDTGGREAPVQEEPINRSPIGKPRSPSDSGGPKMASMRGAPGESASSAVRSFANRFLGVK